MAAKHLTILALFVGLSACRKPASTSMEGGDAAVSVADASANGVAVSEADVRKVIDNWLASQNAGDFHAYEALYADRFEGVRRSGSQTAKLDRARWMKEREGMFRQKPVVAAKDIVIAPTPNSATVTFNQSWSASSYRDEGPKRMVLTRASDGALKISREEMLRSLVIGPGPLPPEKFAFTIDVGTPHLVLSTHVDDAWATGAPTQMTVKYPVVTARPANTSKLPSELASWMGKKVELFGKSGVACEGTVESLAVVGRVDPSDDTRMRWAGTGVYESERKMRPADVAQEAWNLSAGAADNGRLLVAQVKAEKPCAGALWGRAAATEKPSLVEAKPADGATKAAMLAELQKTKAYAQLEASYFAEKTPSDPPRWIDFDARTTALAFAHPSGTIVTLSISAGTGCGTFGGTLSGAWMQNGSTLVPIQDPNNEELAPTSAGDVDGDGKLDLMFEEGLIRAKRGGTARLEAPIKLGFPMLGCGC